MNQISRLADPHYPQDKEDVVIKLIAFAAAALGAGLTATKAPSVLIPTSQGCREATQYNVNTGNIVDCPPVTCDLTSQTCKRDDVTYQDSDGHTVTIVFCSCGQIDPQDIFAGTICHGYRFHVLDTTEMKCNKEGCTSPQECNPDSQVNTVRACKCS